MPDASNSTGPGVLGREALLNPTEELYSRLIHKMHLTKGARYQAARRHQSMSIASIWSVIFLSMYVFTSSVVLSIYGDQIGPSSQLLLTGLNIVMSAFILALSVLEHGKKHDLKAELFLRCAQGISDLYDIVDFEFRSKKIGDDEIMKHLLRYQALIREFYDNHSEVDYRSFRVNIGKHKGEPIYSLIESFKYKFSCWSLMWLSFLVPPLTVFVFFSYLV